jgi:sodium/potassium-transporting ATPase subunit beta
MPNIESTLIKFKQGEKTTYVHLTNNIDEHLKDYKARVTKPLGMNCTELPANYSHPDGDLDSFCEFDLSDLGSECTAANSYGYHENKPCVLLKINKVYDWTPRPFTEAELNDPDNKLAQEAKQKLGDRLDPAYVGVTCEGENEGDADNLRQIRYFPEKGFPLKYYPYYNQPNYLAPIVFVQFDTPKEGVLIQVWCKLWVSNIKHHKNDKAGSIHFELLVD